MNSIIKSIKGPAAAVPGDDIDTDRIMPARYLRCVTFESIGQYTFQDERFDIDGKKKNHPFNDEKNKGAAILVVNKNFGCGSSREHAPQGIHRWGIKAIIGESFAEIFAGNCAAIGMPAVTASETDVKELMAFLQKNPAATVEIDIEKKSAFYVGKTISVDIRDAARKMFLEGTWDTTATLLAAGNAVKSAASNIPYMNWPAA